MKKFIVLFFLLLAVCIVLAQQVIEIHWLAIAAIAIAISYLVIGIIYALAKAFDNDEYLAWSMNELYQATAMLFIVFFIFVASTIEFQVLQGFGFTPTTTEPNPAITKAITYLGEVKGFLFARLATTGIVYASIQGSLTSLRGVEERYGPISIKYEDIMSVVAGKIKEVTSLALTGFSAALLATIAQLYFIRFIETIAFTLILPIGIVLRITPFLRNVGSAMIAIAIGFYLIYPLTFMLNESILDTIREGWREETILRELTSKEGIVTGVTLALGTTFGEIASKEGKLGTKIASLPARTRGFITVGKFLFATTVFYASLPMIVHLIEVAGFAVVVLGILLPILNIVITFGVIREIGSILGTDVKLDDVLKIL